MADIPIECPNGSIEISVNLATAKDGNKALADARADATSQAKSQKRQLTGEYGTRRDGDVLAVVFPLKAL